MWVMENPNSISHYVEHAPNGFELAKARWFLLPI